MDFLRGITNLTNWLANVIMPTLAALFFAIGILRYGKGYAHGYIPYAGFACLMVSGLIRGLEKFSVQAARTALLSGRSTRLIAGPHRSLRAKARNCTMCWPVSSFHLAPQRFMRISNKLLQVASTLPLPRAKPSCRARA